MKDSTSHHGRNRQQCKGGTGRGSDSFVGYKTNRKRRHLAGVKTETKWFARICAHWYWKWVVEPRHSFQKEAGQDLSNLREGGNSASVQDWHLNSALLFPSAESEIIMEVYLFLVFYLWVATVLQDEEAQAQVTGATNGFWILLVCNRPGVFLAVTKYCSPRVRLESGSDCDQKLPKCSTPIAEFSMCLHRTETAIYGWGLRV